MRKDGNSAGISPRSRHDQRNNDGKRRPSGSSTSSKKPSKYTIIRTPQDIENINKARKWICMNDFSVSTKTDAAIYKALPVTYLNAVETMQQQDLLIRKLTAELGQLAELKGAFCRIFDLCKEKRKP